MLKAILGTKKESISDVSGYFDAEYEVSWFDSQLARDIIMGIDLSEYVSDEFIKSPVLGGISPRDLSTGCKGVLLLLNEPELLVCGERFGDNCFEWLFKIADKQDITITLSHIPQLGENFQLEIVNSGKVVKNMKEFMQEILSLRKQGGILYD